MGSKILAWALIVLAVGLGGCLAKNSESRVTNAGGLVTNFEVDLLEKSSPGRAFLIEVTPVETTSIVISIDADLFINGVGQRFATTSPTCLSIIHPGENYHYSNRISNYVGGFARLNGGDADLRVGVVGFTDSIAVSRASTELIADSTYSLLVGFQGLEPPEGSDAPKLKINADSQFKYIIENEGAYSCINDVSDTINGSIIANNNLLTLIDSKVEWGVVGNGIGEISIETDLDLVADLVVDGEIVDGVSRNFNQNSSGAWVSQFEVEGAVDVSLDLHQLRAAQGWSVWAMAFSELKSSTFHKVTFTNDIAA